MTRTFKYITIGGQADSYLVYNTKAEELLGQIKYYSKWREYEFYPHLGTAWSWDCLRDLSGFIKELNDQRKASRGLAI